MKDLNVLADKQLFFGLGEDQIRALVDVADEKTYGVGEDIFREGEMGDSIVVIISGKVDLIKKKKDGGEAKLATYPQGAFFGEMTLINVEPRSATIRAAEDTVALFLKNTDLGKIIQTDRELFIILLMNMTRILSKRLRQANEKLMSA